MRKKIKEILVLQRGIVYFLIRPKIGIENPSTQDETQRFMMLLNPHLSKKFILVIVGKKHLPENGRKGCFAFIDKVSCDDKTLSTELQAKYYHTKTRGDRTLPKSVMLGYGRYLILNNQKRTDFLYKLFKACKNETIQANFNIKECDEFVVQVKNPSSLSSFSLNSTLDLPNKLKEVFKNHKFIPLMPVDFLFYEGVEILLNQSRTKSMLELMPEITTYLNKEIKEELLPQLIN